MSKIKVAIVHYMFGCGGAERVVADLAIGLDKTLVDARVICIYGSSLGNEKERDIVESGGHISYLGLTENDNPFLGIRRLWEELNDFKPDVIHSHLGALQYCLPWAMFHRVRLIHTIHNVPDVEVPSSLIHFLMKKMYRCRRAIPVAISSKNKELTAEYYEIPASYVELVNNPIDADFYCPAPDTTEVRRSFRFINVAGLRKQKNQKMLISAFSMLRSKGIDAELYIVGGGVEGPGLIMHAQSEGVADSVTFVGEVDHKERLLQLLRESDIFVMSSDFEGLPIAALEAMACALPVISTDVGGMSDLIKGNGILVSRGDTDGFARAMIELVGNAARREQMGKLSRSMVSDFDLKTCAQKYTAIYQRCATNEHI